MQGKELFLLIVSDYSPLVVRYHGGTHAQEQHSPTMAARKQGRAREVRHTGKGDGAGNTSTFQGQASSDPLSPTRTLHLLQITPVPQIPLVSNQVAFSHMAFRGYFRSKPLDLKVCSGVVLRLGTGLSVWSQCMAVCRQF